MPWIAATIGAGGSLLGGALGADSAGDAADAQLRGLREGRNLDMASYLASLGINEPFRQSGGNALNALNQLFGLPTQQFAPAQDIARQNLQAGQASNNKLGAKAILKLLKQGRSIQEISQLGSLKSGGGVLNKLGKRGVSAGDISQLQAGPLFSGQNAMNSQAPSGAAQGAPAYPPGYNFFREEGQRDLLGSFGAGGQGAFSGNALKGLTQFNQEYAGRNMIDPLFRLAGFGSQGNQNAQQATQNFGNNDTMRNAMMGDARASGIANQGNIWGNAISGAANSAGRYWNQPSQLDEYQRLGQQGWDG